MDILTMQGMRVDDTPANKQNGVFRQQQSSAAHDNQAFPNIQCKTVENRRYQGWEGQSSRRGKKCFSSNDERKAIPSHSEKDNSR